MTPYTLTFFANFLSRTRQFRLLFLLLLTAFLLPLHAAAGPNLGVEFEATPLFSSINILPGDSVTRFVRVGNATVSAQNAATEVINVFDTSSLASVIGIKIQEGATSSVPLVEKQLSALAAQGETFLSAIPANTTTTYFYTLTFLSTSSNVYQNAALGFDLIVGLQGALTPPPVAPGGGVSGGGGGGNPPPGLTIVNEFATTTEVSSTSVTIAWTTSYKSTSRVVYGITPGVFTYSTSVLALYGYASTTPETDTPANPNGVLNHAVTVTGLTPATTYYYRAISHASPDTVSREFSFRTREGGTGVEVQLPSGFVSPRTQVALLAQNGTIRTRVSNEGAGGAGDGETIPVNSDANSQSVSEELPDSLVVGSADAVLQEEEERGLLATLIYAMGSMPSYVYFVFFVALLSLGFAMYLRTRLARQED